MTNWVAVGALIDSMKTVLEAVVGRVIYSFIMTEPTSLEGDDWEVIMGIIDY